MRTRVVRTALIAAIVVAATASSASAATIVRGNSARWHPGTVRIARGETVKWASVDVHHTVRAYGSNWTYSKQLHPGASTAPRRFNKRGTFRFYCTIHGSVSGGTCSGMCGKVVVD